MRAKRVTDDERVLTQAQDKSGLTESRDLTPEAVLALVQRESAERLAQLGGSEPQLRDIQRAQPKA